MLCNNLLEQVRYINFQDTEIHEGGAGCGTATRVPWQPKHGSFIHSFISKHSLPYGQAPLTLLTSHIVAEVEHVSKQVPGQVPGEALLPEPRPRSLNQV